MTTDPAFIAYDDARRAGGDIFECLRAYQDVWLKQPHMVAKMKELEERRREAGVSNEEGTHL